MANLRKILTKVREVISGYDQDLWGHCSRTAELCERITSGMLSLEERDKLYFAAQVHDIGKIYIPSRILTKPGRLTEEERHTVDLHSMWGYIFLRKEGVPEDICQLVLLHHGYKKEKFGLPFDSPCFMADILRACDIYDAITSNRPYHKKESGEEALQILACQKEPIPVLILQGISLVSATA